MYTQLRPSGESLTNYVGPCGLKLASPVLKVDTRCSWAIMQDTQLLQVYLSIINSLFRLTQKTLSQLWPPIMAGGHKHKQVFTQYVHYIYPILTSNGMYQQISVKSNQTWNHKNPSGGSRYVPCGRTDMTIQIEDLRHTPVLVLRPRRLSSVCIWRQQNLYRCVWPDCATPVDGKQCWKLGC